MYWLIVVWFSEPKSGQESYKTAVLSSCEKDDAANVGLKRQDIRVQYCQLQYLYNQFMQIKQHDQTIYENHFTVWVLVTVACNGARDNR